MHENGLIPVLNPSRIFLDERSESVTGSVVTAVVEGSRPFLVELQGLVSPTSFGIPRRTVSGINLSRASIVIAVLERRLNLRFGSDDIYINVVGGVDIDEPSADLAIAMALLSCFKNKKMIPETVVFGEIGLGGEIRAVSQPEIRLSEAEKLGFKRVIMPAGNVKVKNKKIEVIGVSNLAEAASLSLV